MEEETRVEPDKSIYDELYYDILRAKKMKYLVTGALVLDIILF